MVGARSLPRSADARDDALDPTDESFSDCLNRYVRRSGLSLSQLAIGSLAVVGIRD